ncbi:MAG: hypothetical protein IPM75_15325 [Candidatus Competibacteraceae bacterium]|nr:hypothetical protein [Candidatus Competibacteraceae bacterium]
MPSASVAEYGCTEGEAAGGGWVEGATAFAAILGVCGDCRSQQAAMVATIPNKTTRKRKSNKNLHDNWAFSKKA